MPLINQLYQNMKEKLFSFLMMTLMVIFGACSTDDTTDDNKPGDGEQPGDKVEQTVDFSLAVNKLTHDSICVQITPSDSTATYYAAIVAASEVDSMAEADFVKATMESQQFAAALRKGASEMEAAHLLAKTKYAVVAFSTNQDGTAGKLFKQYLTTNEAPVTGDKFTVSGVTPSYTSVKFHVKPRELTLKWYYYIMEKKYYEEYLNNEGINGPITHTYYAWNNIGRDTGMNIGEYLALVCYQGESDVEVPRLEQNKDYVIIAAYVDPANQIDPNDIFDYDYSATHFTTLKASSEAPEIEILDSGVADTGDGYVDVYATVRTNVANDGRYSFSSLANWLAQGSIFEAYETDENIAYTMANLFGRALSEEAKEGLTSAGGYTFTQSLARTDYEENKPLVFAIWVNDEQGKRKAIAVRVE